MTLQQFRQDFCLKATIQETDVKFTVITEVVRRTDNVVVREVKSPMDIQETNNSIFDSNSLASLNPLDSEQIIEETKRSHLGIIALNWEIEDWALLDRQSNQDILDLYC